jgi:adenine-specific DNA-methyltransferase
LDLYHLFIERSNNLLKPNGLNSLIVPNAFLANQNNIRLRKYILDNFYFISIIDIRDDVFEEASVDVLIYLFSKSSVNEDANNFVGGDNTISFSNVFEPSSFRLNRNYNFSTSLSPTENLIVQKIERLGVTLSDIYECSSGIKEYQIGKGKPPQSQAIVKGKVFNSNEKLDSTYLPEIRGKNLVKYGIKWNNEFISFGDWLAEPRDIKYSLGERILIRQIPGKESLICSFVEEDFVVDQTAYIIKPKPNQNRTSLDIGLLNSSLMFWYFRNLNNEFDLLFPKIKIGEIKSLPLLSERNELIEEKVNQILSLKKENLSADSSALEAEIDQMVYELYDLTAKEIAIVEGH